jgi:hypothetical protein
MTTTELPSEAGERLREDTIRDLAVRYGIPANPVTFAETPESAAAVAMSTGRPVAVKLVADGVVHKSKAGGVLLDIVPQQVAAAVEKLFAEQRARGVEVRGVTVEPMIDPGPEVVGGALHDPGFGPIVLVPQLLQTHGRSAFTAGLVVASLPVGFAVGALSSERLLPARWGSDRRGLLGALIALAGLGALIAAQTRIAPDVVLLIVLGLGLGLYIPANNAVIMSAVSARVSALTGGLVNTARALGTAAGTAVVAVTLTAGDGRTTAAVLLVIALVIPAVVARRRRPG